MKKKVIITIILFLLLICVLVYTHLRKAMHPNREFSNAEMHHAEAHTVSEKSSFFSEIFESFSPQVNTIPVLPDREDTPVRAIYVSAPAMNSPKVREKLIEILDTTRINALVIDVKDSSGYVYLPITEEKYKFTERVYSQNAQDFIKSMEEKGVYLIARIVVFQDPLMVQKFPEYALKDKDGSIWRDRKGMAFLDPQNKHVWDHTVQLSLKTAQFGFDEINYDYIRYPSDGKISNIKTNIPEGKTKAEMMEVFFKFVYDEVKVKNGIYISADIFGDSARIKGDPGIGQIFEKTLPYFDAVAPMVYPSHFSPGSYGIAEPNKFPKEIMEGSARDMNRRLEAWCPVVKPIELESPKTSTIIDDRTHTSKREKTDQQLKELQENYEKEKKRLCSAWKNRPWVQDFSLGYPYGIAEVKGQIQALENAGVDSWMVWNPSSRYTIDAFK